MNIPLFLDERFLPSPLGGLAYEGADVYPDPRLGARFRYAGAGGTKADAYLYDLGRGPFSSDLRSSELVGIFRQSCGDVLRLAEQGLFLELDEPELRVLHLSDEAQPFCLWAVFTYRQAMAPGVTSGDRRVSHLALRTDRGLINKVRFTYMAEGPEAASGFDRFTRFLREWTAAIHGFGGPDWGHS